MERVVIDIYRYVEVAQNGILQVVDDFVGIWGWFLPFWVAFFSLRRRRFEQNIPVDTFQDGI